MDANKMRHEFNLRLGGTILSNKTFDDREISSFLSKAQLEYTLNRIAPWKNRPQLGVGDSEIRNSELSGLLSATQSILREHHLLGTKDNGALYGPDLDKADQPMDQFGVFVGVPDEVLYIMSERVATTKNATNRLNGKVIRKTKIEYVEDIFNSNNNPYSNLTWSMDWGTYTTSSVNGVGNFNSSTKSFSETGTGFNMEGLNHLGNTININTDRSVYLIPGKGWKVTDYTISYIKQPSDIVVDVQMPASQISCQLPNFVHSDIVDLAVKLASASLVPEQSKYQVAQVESKEDE